jgi:hypothetical protein
MEVIKIDAEKATIKFTLDDLLNLNQALNEICHGLRVPNFELKIGVSKEEAKRLLMAVQTLLDEMESSTQDSQSS